MMDCRIVGPILSLICILSSSTLVGRDGSHPKLGPYLMAEGSTSFPSQAFVANCGQWDSAILYSSSSRGARIGLSSNALILQLSRKVDAQTIGASVQLSFVGGAAAGIEGEDCIKGYYNYLRGNDRSQWHTRVPAYRSVLYRDLFDGVNVRVRFEQGRLEYDLILDPRARPAEIGVRCEGVTGLEINKHGDLVLHTEIGTIAQPKPVAWNELPSGERELVTCRYRIRGPMEFGFEVVGARSDVPLVIDPIVDWTTYFGGSHVDQILDADTDHESGLIVTGRTDSLDFPYSFGAYDIDVAPTDAFVARLDSDGSLIYATILGGEAMVPWPGSSADWAESISVARSGEAVVGGATNAIDFPVTPGAYRENPPAAAGWSFVTRLNESGTDLVFSTYLGPDSSVRDLSLTGSEDVVLVGSTTSGYFPRTVGAWDQSFNGTPGQTFDGFVARLHSSGGSLVYSTFLGGGGGGTSAEGVVVDSTGVATVAGFTTAVGFPATGGAFDSSHNGNRDAFVTRLNATGGSLVYSTFLGSFSNDEAHALSLLESGDVVVVGKTLSSVPPVFPTTPGAISGVTSGSRDVFATQLDSTGQIVWSTLLGGSEFDAAYAVDVGEHGVAIAGGTISSDFPTTPNAPYRNYRGVMHGNIGADGDAFLAIIDSFGSEVLFSTYLGGQEGEAGRSVFFSGSDLYIAGTTFSVDFPVTPGAFDGVLDPGQSMNPDGFIAKLILGADTPFIRGDADGDGTFRGLADATFVLAFQFVPGSPVPPCQEAADADGDGSLSGLLDGLFVLNAQFVPGSPEPPLPYPTCGEDPDPASSLGCQPNGCP